MNLTRGLHDENKMHLYPLHNEATSGVLMGSLTRHGGRSNSPFDSNNISTGVGDKLENVKRNREQIKKYLGLEYLVSAHQVHGDKIYHITSPLKKDFVVDGYDALITDIRGVGLLIGHADCQAVMMYDKVQHVVAAIHSGWRGSVANIVAKTILTLQQSFNSNPKDLLVGVGPSLGPCCSEFKNYHKELPESFLQFQIKSNHFNFWKITQYQLIQCGVLEESIAIAKICTSCSSDYFSYRRSCRNGEGITGRNGSVIALVE